MHWFTSLFATLLIFTQPVLASMNKCVDENGRYHYYANVMPAECQNQATVEMNKGGVVLRTHAVRIKTEDETDPAIQAAEEQRRIEEQRRDTVLLSTYTNEEEIDWAMERNIHPIELAITGIEKRLEIATNNLQKLQKQVNQAKKSGSPGLTSLQESLIPATRDVKQLQHELKRNHDRIDGLTAKFSADRKRFRELKQENL